MYLGCKPVREKISPALFVRYISVRSRRRVGWNVRWPTAAACAAGSSWVLTLHRLTPASVAHLSIKLGTAGRPEPRARGDRRGAQEPPPAGGRSRARREEPPPDGADGGGAEWSRLGRRNEGRPGEEPGGHGGRLAALPGCREAARLRQ